MEVLDVTCKCEMDPASILCKIQSAQFRPQTDRRTGGRIDRRADKRADTMKPVYTLSNSLKRGV